jgi:hypothetical protein
LFFIPGIENFCRGKNNLFQDFVIKKAPSHPANLMVVIEFERRVSYRRHKPVPQPMYLDVIAKI